MVFEDESGFCLVSPLRYTWSRRGRTPRTRTRIEHQKRLNALGFLIVSPTGRRIRAFTKLTRRRVNGDVVLSALRRLLREVSGPIVLVWDNAPFHTQRKVQNFIEHHRRMQVFNFPTYAPELNPVEYMWANANAKIANMAFRDMAQLDARLRRVLRGIAACSRLLRGFIDAARTHCERNARKLVRRRPQ